MKEIKAKLDAYGMKLGLWFGPTTVALTSQMLKTHADCPQTMDGKARDPWVVWETEASLWCCVDEIPPAFCPLWLVGGDSHFLLASWHSNCRTSTVLAS